MLVCFSEGLYVGLSPCPWAELTGEPECSFQLSIPGSGIQTRAGPFVSKAVVDWSANESIRKLLAAEISAKGGLCTASENHGRPYAYKSLLAVALVNRTPAFLGPVNHLRKMGRLLLCRAASCLARFSSLYFCPFLHGRERED